MKTLAHHHRTQLETEIIKMIITNPDLMNKTNLLTSDFGTPLLGQIYTAISDLRFKGKVVSLVNLSETVNASDIAFLFTQGDYFTVSPLDFVAACNELKEDVMRNAINRQAEQSGSSLDFYDWIDAQRKINTVYSIESFKSQFEKYTEEFKEIKHRQNQGIAVGLLTGYNRFNEKVGLSNCDFCVIGGRTSMGKTTFALNVAIEAAAFGEKVLFISLEMPRKQIFDKICARLMKQPTSDFKFGKANLEHCKNELQVIADNFNFVFAPDCKTTDIQSMAAMLPDVKLIIVDYLQLLKDPQTKGETENNRLGRISGKLKMIAGLSKCVVMTPAQLNRGNEKEEREPRLSDLRDSGCIEQDADQVLLLHRANRESVTAKLIIAKNRHGSLGTIEYDFNPVWGWFSEDPDQI